MGLAGVGAQQPTPLSRAPGASPALSCGDARSRGGHARGSRAGLVFVLAAGEPRVLRSACSEAPAPGLTGLHVE